MPSNDPSVLASAIAYATEHLGIAFTASILQEHPFNFARRITTLDHASKGRVAWNIVTNYLPNASRNFGLEGLTKHDERYAWADEYVDVTYKLWEGSWEEDAFVQDRETGIHARLRQGAQDQPRGPALPGRGPAPRDAEPAADAAAVPGRCFRGGPDVRRAQRRGRLHPVAQPQSAARDTADIRARAVQHGRQAEDVKFFQGLYSSPARPRRRRGDGRRARRVDRLRRAALAHVRGGRHRLRSRGPRQADRRAADRGRPVDRRLDQGPGPGPAGHAARRRALHGDQQPHRRDARADRRRAGAVAGGGRRRDQPGQRRDPGQLRGVRRPRHPGAPGPRPRAEGVRRGHAAPEALRPGRPSAGPPPGRPLPRCLRARQGARS